MIEYIEFLRSVVKFESVNSGVQLPFSKLTLLYAENARGKTTLAAVLRSLSDGDPTPILERRRLSASDPPHVVIKTATPTHLIFQNGAWTSTLPDLAIFDDAFVAQNVCSGIDVQTEHKQNLHELILGTQGVAERSRMTSFRSRAPMQQTSRSPPNLPSFLRRIHFRSQRLANCATPTPRFPISCRR